MNIRPSNVDWMFAKNWIHFYALLGFIPVAVIGTIIGIRANPELSEVPDGYEPRYWEYFRHPITRWMARTLYTSNEQTLETNLSLREHMSEDDIFKKITAKADKVMSFYNDHRSRFFLAKYGDYYRTGRDEGFYLAPMFKTEMAQRTLEVAYDPDSDVLPVEGFPDGPMKKD